MRELLLEYRQSRDDLLKMIENLGNSELDKLDKRLINSMIDSVTKSIEWLETGRNPYYQQGIDVRYAYDITRLPYMDILPDLQDHLTVESEPLEITDEHIDIFKKVISVLSDREWECFVLHNASCMSMSEIADKLDISKSTVQTHIKRARGKIKELV